MKIRAAVMHGASEPLDVCELDLAPPARDEVCVRILATGICRSDLSYIDGKWPTPLPIVLGHEGAGTIEAVGEGVDPGRVGEPVVLTFSPACGRCRQCLSGRANLCLDAANGLDSGFLRDGTSAPVAGRPPGPPPRLRIELCHPRRGPRRCGAARAGASSTRVSDACWVAA